MSSAPTDELTQAARLQRRWRGLGGVLFMLFYSVFFATHMELAGTTLYLQDDVLLGSPTASFVHDLTAERLKAGSVAGSDGAFLLLHHAPVRLLTGLWRIFSENETTAGRHAVTTLTAGAGAVTLGLLYQALMWSGVGRVRAFLFACLAGTSMALLLFAALPLPQIFSALGLTAALAAVVRARSGRWWEFAAASLYATCCSPANLMPVLLLALVRVIDQWRTSGSLRPVMLLPVNLTALVLLSLSAVQVQGWIYPRSSQVGFVERLESSAQDVRMAMGRLAEADWALIGRQTVLTGVIAPDIQEGGESAKGAKSRKVVLKQETGDLQGYERVLLVVWFTLLVVGLLGLFTAGRGAAAALALIVGGMGLAATMSPGTQVAQSVLWVPALVFLAGIGIEQHVRRWRILGVPVGLVVLGLILALGLHNAHFVAKLGRTIAL